jgi:hypothetical protein
VDIESTASGTPVTFTVNPTGQDGVQVSQIGQDLDSLQGGLTLVGTAAASLTVNAQSNAASHSYTVNDTQVLRDTTAITLTSGTGTFGQLVVHGSTGPADTFDVTPSKNTTITVDGGTAGTATLTVHTPAGANLQDDHSGNITDTNGLYQPVHYSDFATVNIV